MAHTHSTLLLALLSLLPLLTSSSIPPPPTFSTTVDNEMTVNVDAAAEDCYFQPAEAGDVIDVEYQVVDGGANNELWINFKLLKPNGIPLVADYRQMDNAHRHDIQEAGDYKICFDNADSRFSAKIIFFNVVVEKASSATEETNEGFPPQFDGAPPSATISPEQYDMSVKDIDLALKSIHTMVSKTRKFQDQIRAQEFRDRSIAERNFERVNFWSVVQVVIMGVAGAAQVVLLRSLFDEKSMLHGLWKRLC